MCQIMPSQKPSMAPHYLQTNIPTPLPAIQDLDLYLKFHLLPLFMPLPL